MLDEEAKGRRTRPEPPKVIDILPRHLHVHTPHTTDDVHWQDDGTEHCQFTENVGCLFLALVHQDIDLRQVIGMRAGQNPVLKKGVSKKSTSEDSPHIQGTTDENSRLIVRQVSSHRHNMVLNIAQVQSNL